MDTEEIVKKPWIRVKLDDGSNYIIKPSELAYLECEINDAIDNEDFEAKWTITLELLSDAEVEALGDFEGH